MQGTVPAACALWVGLDGRSVRTGPLERVEFGRKVREPPGLDRRANFRHQALIKIQIVYRVKVRAQYFAALIQMTQIGAAVVAAGIARAPLFDRTGVLVVRCV